MLQSVLGRESRRQSKKSGPILKDYTDKRNICLVSVRDLGGTAISRSICYTEKTCAGSAVRTKSGWL